MPDKGQSLLALAEQRGQRCEAQLNRGCSALTSTGIDFGQKNLNIHPVLQVKESGQLPELGSGHLSFFTCTIKVAGAAAAQAWVVCIVVNIVTIVPATFAFFGSRGVD